MSLASVKEQMEQFKPISWNKVMQLIAVAEAAKSVISQYQVAAHNPYVEVVKADFYLLEDMLEELEQE